MLFKKRFILHLAQEKTPFTIIFCRRYSCECSVRSYCRGRQTYEQTFTIKPLREDSASCVLITVTRHLQVGHEFSKQEDGSM
jgi:hypothetical protein